MEVTNDPLQELSPFLSTIGFRGILTMLKQRKTPGSIDYFLPSRQQLINSFNVMHNKDLSVGGRALDKHCKRSVTDNFWGTMTGGAKQRNEKAIVVLEKILEQADWINSHLLPHGIPCFEVRTVQGYGARWVYSRGNPQEQDKEDDIMIFRGFLEP
ncbi:hypothetical protein AKO1_008089, partial [Acrasis kona]